MTKTKKLSGEFDSVKVCKETRIASGAFDSESRLTAFLYLLMRDESTCGEVAALVGKVSERGKFEFTNGWLAKYAAHLALRLTKE